MHKNKIIAILSENQNKVVSGGMIANRLNISRNAVFKHIKSLKEEGFAITSIPNKGYVLSANNKLSKEILESHLKNPLNVIVLDTVDSTNNYAKSIAIHDSYDTIIAANTQTAGRGRLMRSFYSPKDTGIYFTMILNPKTVLLPNLITPLAAVGVFRVLKATFGIETKIKWVNDLFYMGKKICGILTEASMDFETNTLSYIILGIGINLNTKDFPAELNMAGSLDVNFSTADRNKLIADIANEIYAILKNIDTDDFMATYKEKSNIVGKKIFVIKPNFKKEAYAVSIDNNGGLNVVYGDESVETLQYGEVSIKGDFYD